MNSQARWQTEKKAITELHTTKEKIEQTRHEMEQRRAGIRPGEGCPAALR